MGFKQRKEIKFSNKTYFLLPKDTCTQLSDTKKLLGGMIFIIYLYMIRSYDCDSIDKIKILIKNYKKI